MFKIKDEYKLELQTPETMKLFGSMKKLIGKAQNGKNEEPWSGWSSFGSMQFSRQLMSTKVWSITYF